MASSAGSIAGPRAADRDERPTAVAARVTRALRIPTIGIGAGPGCDGQVMVMHDLLGLEPSWKPRFVRRYATLGATIRDAVSHYVTDVRASAFPSDAESFTLEVKQGPSPAEPALYSTAAAKR